MSEPAIAIIGMACMYPGARDVDAFWSNIVGKVDAVSDPPPGSWDTARYHDPAFEDRDKVYVRRGGYLGDLAEFDPLQHGIPPVAVGGEPDQWLALQLASDALADAGCTDMPTEVRHRTAIVLGKGTYLNGGNAVAVQRAVVVEQTLDLLQRLDPELGAERIGLLRAEMKRVLPPMTPETVPGLIPNVIVGRIANRLDLMGPCYTVDAACASSLVAVQLAVRDLRAGSCDLALAGGSQVWMPVPSINLFCQLGALSRAEVIRPFDENADGTLLGEGIGMVVLKRYDDAVRDGDRVYALVCGVGVASDGRGAGVMAPRIEGEELALRRAYADAGVDPISVGLIEAHGTATPVGDVVEIAALRRVFGGRYTELPRIALGSVKSMISHTIPAAGIAGIIKSALALHHKVLPPTLHVTRPNPKLELETTPFYLNSETRPWVHGGEQPRRAGINAFGFGGINAHAVLEEALEDLSPRHALPWDSELCVLESTTRTGLADAADELARRLADGPGPALAEVAAGLARRIGTGSPGHRLALVAGTVEDLTTKALRAAARLRDPACVQIKEISGAFFTAQPLSGVGGLAFLFPGEGAQYTGMLADLCLRFRSVRAEFDRADARRRGGLTISQCVFPPPAFSDSERAAASHRLIRMDTAIEAVLTANTAMLALTRELGITPEACVGHSSGEYSAGYASGTLALADERQINEFAGRLQRSYAAATDNHELPSAVLLSIGADREQAEALARDAGGGMEVAIDNCPHQAVLIGHRAEADRVIALAARGGLVCEELGYDRPVHTGAYAPFADRLRSVMAEVPVAAGSSRLWCCATAAPYPPDADAVRALFVDQWAAPVEFRRTVEAMYEAGTRVFLEVGPRGNLTAFVDDILRGREMCAVAMDVQRRSGTKQLNMAMGMLFAQGVPFDIAALTMGRVGGASAGPGWDDAGWKPAASGVMKMKLATGWPKLEVSEDVLAQVRERPAAVEPPAPAQASAQEAASARPVGEPEPAITQPPPLSEAEPMPRSVPDQHSAVSHVDDPFLPMQAFPPMHVLDLEDREAALDHHLVTMSQFLDVSEQVMQAYLGAAPAAPSPFPLLGEVVAEECGTELVAQRMVSLDADRYLRDHSFGGSVSVLDPNLSGLAVMPLTMTLELLAEAAARLVPGLLVTGFRSVQAHRWIGWDLPAQLLEIHARRLPTDGVGQAVEVSVRSLDDDGRQPGDLPAVEGVVLLADRYPSGSPLADPAPLAGSGRSRSLLYGAGGMFHGPCWQGVATILGSDATGCAAELRTLPAHGLLRADPAPALQIDPVVLDAAGQVVGFWAAEQLPSATVVFPVRVDSIDLHGPRRPAGELLPCVSTTRQVGDLLLDSDIDVQGAGGEPWMRIRGWVDRRFPVPAELVALLRPAASELSTDTTRRLLGASMDRATLCCRRMTVDVATDVEFWSRVWSSRIFGPSERERFRDWTGPDRRRIEHLAGRTAAKEAVCALVLRATGSTVRPADVELLPDPLGRPIAGGALVRQLPFPVHVSIAHTHGVAVAVAGLGADTARLGIDVERIGRRSAAFVDVAFDRTGQELLAAVGPAERDDWAVRCWCAKEAVGKAVGTGLPDPTAVSVEAIRPDQGVVVVRLGETLAGYAPDLTGQDLQVCVTRDGDVVVAITTCQLAAPSSTAGPAAMAGTAFSTAAHTGKGRGGLVVD